MIKSTLLALLTLLFGSFAALPAAEIKPASIFSDHMVLQRDRPVPVWGQNSQMTPKEDVKTSLMCFAKSPRYIKITGRGY